MTITIGIALALVIIGFLMYMFLTNAKLAEVGRLMLFCGLLAFALQSGAALHK